jgi:putative spermidine/putrescine transport system ATP-binding protein
LGISFLHVTHSQDEAMALADLIVVMNGGHIEQAGTPRDVFNAPRTAFVAQFMGGHNVIAADGGKIAVRADRTATLTEAEFDSGAVHPGQEVAVDWSDQDGHRLSDAA